MIFRRRQLACWLGDDWTDYYSDPPLLEFSSEEELIRYVKMKLPRYAEHVHIKGKLVCNLSVIGFIE